MYTVLIVDDEPLVRRGVSRMIDWESLGFTTVLQAEDGMEALEMCKKNKIDLVLTDIVMPFMNGIELATILGQEFPDIQVVILTGHEDFEWAKQSVDLGVKNYILKPVGANTLYEKMQGICKRLYLETKQKNYIEKMRRQLHQSIPVLQEKFLYMVVCTENRMRTDLSSRIETLELPLRGKSYQVAIVELDLAEIDGSDIEIYLFSAKNVIQECVGMGNCVFDYNNKVGIVFNLDYYEEADQDIVYKTVQVIQKALHLNLRIDNTCALGTVVNKPEQLNESWKEANTALDCKYSLGINRVYDIYDLDYIEKSFYYPFEEIQNLVNSIKFMSEEEIQMAVQKIGQSLANTPNVSSANIRMVFIEILTSLLKELSIVKEVAFDVWTEGFELYSHLDEVISIEHMNSKLLAYSKKVSMELHKSQKNSGQLMIQKVGEYMEKHYMDETLTLSSMAEVVGVSMGYLSALFKKETGINFIEKLTHIRMEHAKELLRTTDKKTYEIAYETGYTNPHYFSISFKKSTGMSPSEYRNKG